MTGATVPAFSYERRGDAGYASLHAEPVGTEVAREPFGALGLEVAKLGVVEKIRCERNCLVVSRVHQGPQFGVCRRVYSDRQRKSECRKRHDQTPSANRMIAVQGISPQNPGAHGSSPGGAHNGPDRGALIVLNKIIVGNIMSWQ